MKRVLIFALNALISVGGAHGAVRDGNAAVRARGNSEPAQRVTTSERTVSARTSVLVPRTTTERTSVARTPSTQSRAATNVKQRTPTTTPSVARGATRTTTARAAAPQMSVVRAATPDGAIITQTRTGAAYEQCKTAFFTCMDQFCTLKNDDYRRCSCSDRIFKLQEARDAIQDAGERLTIFTENLTAVGMTAAQATAMKTASDGENALTSDTSASKALLQAIMNSIRGDDSNVGGKYSDLNSINISFDTVNAFGITDAGAAIANYNGQNLYSAVYPQCRNAVAADCNDASLQRAINAYLMAIEQDCNTVETAVTERQKQVKSAVREGSAMLDLARVENRQKHNSDNIATCVANVETAVLSEEVCGAGYHKCLDNGEYIDISSGAPIAGITDFYKLGQLLTFPVGASTANLKLTKITSNRTFVKNFETRVKKFAQPALDKCTEQADTVWGEYLDKAMLDIYYAQNSKVETIKQGCLDFISACYENSDAAITAAMAELTGASQTMMQPYRLTLTDQMCKDYIASCDNMFGEDAIVQNFIKKRTDADTLDACRAITKQCFDKYGGDGYANFYYPYSGVFSQGKAADWFTLYETVWEQDKDHPIPIDIAGIQVYAGYKSECAKELTKIEMCNDDDIIKKAFGGFDSFWVQKYNTKEIGTQWDIVTAGTQDAVRKYGIAPDAAANVEAMIQADSKADVVLLGHRRLRSSGIATEIYNQIIDNLTVQCRNMNGRFVPYQQIPLERYNESNYCSAAFTKDLYRNIIENYRIGVNENMCPANYDLTVDTASWGACLCWENGGRRSKFGKSSVCVAAFPTSKLSYDASCSITTDPENKTATNESITTLKTSELMPQNEVNVSTSVDSWCTIPYSSKLISAKNQVCIDSECKGTSSTDTDISVKDEHLIPEGFGL